MTRVLLGVLVALVLGGLAVASEPVGLSPIQKLQAENLQLKDTVVSLQVQLTQCQVQQATAALASQRATLEAEFRATLTPPAGSVFDWTSLTFKEPSR